MKRSVKHDKRNRIDALASATQTAANIGDISAVYKITKEVTNNNTNIEHPVKDIDGHFLLSDEEQMNRLEESFFFGAKSSFTGECSTIYWTSASNENQHPYKHRCTQHSGDYCRNQITPKQ